MFKQFKGFTLIELMIVSRSSASCRHRDSAYQNYTILPGDGRSDIGRRVETAIAEYYANSGTFPHHYSTDRHLLFDR